MGNSSGVDGPVQSQPSGMHERSLGRGGSVQSVGALGVAGEATQGAGVMGGAADAPAHKPSALTVPLHVDPKRTDQKFLQVN